MQSAGKSAFSIKKIIPSGFVVKDQSSSTPKSVGLILLALLLVSVFFGSVKKKNQELERVKSETKAFIDNNISEASEVVQINPISARQLILQSEERLKTFEKQYGQSLEESEKLISDAKRQVLGEFNAITEKFLDYSVIFSDFEAFSGSSYEDNLYIYDSSIKRIIKLNLLTKRSEIVASKSLISDVLSIIPNKTGFFYIAKNGVYKSDGGVIFEGIWEKAIGLSFASNLYILDPGSSKIVRHQSTGIDSFSEGQNWLKEDLSLDLHDARTFVSDGSLWVLTQDDVYKLSLGNKNNFSVKGIDLSMFSPTDIYTDEESQFIYFLDIKNSKIWVTDKKGVFKASYLSEDFSKALKIVLREGEKKAFVITPESVLSFSLNHIE